MFPFFTKKEPSLQVLNNKKVNKNALAQNSKRMHKNLYAFYQNSTNSN